jgi:15,16-dihydrobiliverdin:ferredoxin oxidoreductase
MVHHDVINAQTLAELNDRILTIRESQDQLLRYQDSSPGRSSRSSLSLEEASIQHGMPWSTTIGKTEEQDPLLYMPFWEWQMNFMNTSLTNLHPIECSTLNNLDVSYNENTDKKARIVNHCYASEEYRKIRMTYYDAGDAVQVFNSVWYPDAKYNLPVLGIDLLSFNRKKYLAIVDFQPLHDEEEDHSTLYEHILKPIKNKYDNLKGRMSSKFYDETQFFSKEMLFARFEDGKIVYDDLFPAFKSYVQTHVDLVKGTSPATTLNSVEFVFERQRAYDTYSAERDPAAGLFAAMFGKDWAEEFIYDFLFSLSERKEEGLNLSPPMLGGPPAAGAGGGKQHGPPSSMGAPKEQAHVVSKEKSKATISMKLQ